MFQIKSVDSITASIINNIQLLSDDLTDFNVGSKNRTLIEAISVEVEQFYQALLKGFYEAVPTALYRSFSFSRLSATKASGYITFTKTTAALSSIIVIPQGTIIRVPNTNYSYETQADITIGSGTSTGQAYVLATATGAAYNASASIIIELDTSIDGIASVSNESAFTTGSNEESDSERKNRWRRYIRTLSRATEDALVYGAKTSKLTDANNEITEYVKDAIIHELHEDQGGSTGYIDVYLWNGTNGASANLITNTTKILNGYTDDDGNRVPGYKGAGIIAVVKAVTTQSTAVTVTVTLDNGVTISSAFEDEIEAKIGEYFSGLNIGETVYIAKMIDMIMDLDDVIDVSFTLPAANVVPEWNKICALGNLTITDGNA